jgi:leucyl/phenylalanyl-tRNA---protein transferase
LTSPRGGLDAGDPLSVANVVAAYAGGYFVMDDPGDPVSLRFESPPRRAVLPLDPARIQHWKTMRRSPHPSFEYRVDAAFEDVLLACAAPRDHGPEPFMTDRVLDMYRGLHRAGFAHSFEAWEPGGDRPVGGILGVLLGRAAMLETMFHRVPGAGNAALIESLSVLADGGYELADVQYGSSHLERWDLERIPRDEYVERLRHALRPTTALEPDEDHDEDDG